MQVVTDNFDASICSEDGLQQIYAIGMILTKFPSDNATEEQNSVSDLRPPRNKVARHVDPVVCLSCTVPTLFARISDVPKGISYEDTR